MPEAAAYCDEVVVVVVVETAASEAGASDIGAMASSTAGDVTSVEVSVVVVVVSAGFEQAATDRQPAATAAIAMILKVLRMIVIPSHQDVKDYGGAEIGKRCGWGADSIKIS